MSRFRLAEPRDGYTFVEDEERAAALMLINDAHLGREALEIAEAYCREAGVNALHLEVERHRAPALELYRRGGFTARALSPRS